MKDGSRARTAVILGSLILETSIGLGPARAQPAGANAQSSFPVQWQPSEIGAGDPAVKGSVDNPMRGRLTNIRLRVDALDDAGRVVGQSFGWVLGDVPSGGRGYFVVPLAAIGVDYRVSVMSYDLVSRGPEGPTPSPPAASPGMPQ